MTHVTPVPMRHLRAHPLDAACACGHALWLHTAGCIARIPSGRSQMQTAACGCGKSLAELTK